jgi:RNA polymerase sigma factor (sigma-70 family)
MSSILHYLRRVALGSHNSDLTDGELLEQFISKRDGACIETLVRRHGPMVLGVCQRILRDQHDAEDAFQAVFLVFVKRASVVPHSAIGNWLYGVAYRTALNARRAASRRRSREKQENDMPHPVSLQPEDWTELRPLIDEELSQLPDKYRSAVVLCDLEGLTRGEAARQLGVPEGTVSGRLTIARRMLATRLSRRGLTLSAGTLSATLTQGATAAIPTPLLASTVRAGELLANGVSTDIVSSQISTLADGVARDLAVCWWKPLLLTVMLTIPVGSAIIVAATRGHENGSPTLVTSTPQPTVPSDWQKLQGDWLIVQAEINGKSILDPGYLRTRFVFAGKQFFYRTNKSDQEGTYQLDTSRTPKSLTVSFGKDAVMECIYELVNDQLKVCWRKGGPRPEGFDSTKELDAVFFVFEKQ